MKLYRTLSNIFGILEFVFIAIVLVIISLGFLGVKYPGPYAVICGIMSTLLGINTFCEKYFRSKLSLKNILHKDDDDG